MVMDVFIEYFKNGMRNSIVVGVPVYDTNNLYLDYENLNSDFTYAKRMVLNEQKQKNYAKSKRKRTK